MEREREHKTVALCMDSPPKCVYAYIYIYTHTHIYIYTLIYVYIYIYHMCIHIYIFIYTCLFICECMHISYIQYLPRIAIAVSNGVTVPPNTAWAGTIAPLAIL